MSLMRMKMLLMRMKTMALTPSLWGEAPKTRLRGAGILCNEILPPRRWRLGVLAPQRRHLCHRSTGSLRHYCLSALSAYSRVCGSLPSSASSSAVTQCRDAGSAWSMNKMPSK